MRTEELSFSLVRKATMRIENKLRDVFLLVLIIFHLEVSDISQIYLIELRDTSRTLKLDISLLVGTRTRRFQPPFPFFQKWYTTDFGLLSTCLGPHPFSSYRYFVSCS